MPKSDSLYIKQVEVGPMQNFIYLLGDAQTREVLVVDPAWDVEAILKIAKEEELTIKGALLTHYHYDHVNGVEAFTEATDGVTYIQQKDIPYLKAMDVNKANIKPLNGESTIQIGKIDVRCLLTPGHTPGSQCFLVNEALVSGDTLFINACGRCDLPGGDVEQMYDSLKRLASLDEKTILYPGHNYSDHTTSTIQAEKLHNPYMQIKNKADFLRFR